MLCGSCSVVAAAAQQVLPADVSACALPSCVGTDAPPSSLQAAPAAAAPPLSDSAACASLRPWGRVPLAQGPCWSDGLSVMQKSRVLIQALA